MTEERLPPAFHRLGPGELLVSETFLSIQGEGVSAGRPCFFIRLAGCHLRCSWCDTDYAFYDGRVATVEECLAEALAAGCRLVEVTGGEPLLQPSVNVLLRTLCDRGYEVLLETSGAVAIDQVDPRVRRIVDWKCPASGEASRNRPAVLDALRPGDELKLVLADRADYDYALGAIETARARNRDIGDAIPVHLSPATGRLHPEELSSWILEDLPPVRLNIQVHKVVWGEDARGV